MASTYIKDYTNTFIIHDHEYEVTAPARFECGSDRLLDDNQLDDHAVEMANQMYRDDQGLVSPIEIKSYRAKIGLNQREFAELLGWSPNTVALYETGAFPSKANNKLLKALMKDAQILRTYLSLDDQLNKMTMQKIELALTKAQSSRSQHPRSIDVS